MTAEGKIITFEEAQQLLSQSEQIKENATLFVVKGLDDNLDKFKIIEQSVAEDDLLNDLHTKASTHYKDPNNIYIFSLEKLTQLLKEKKATHIMVIKGSQIQEIDSFKKGQPTVIIIPCNDTGDTNEQGKIFNTIGEEALEHPQVRYEPISLFEDRHDEQLFEIMGNIDAVNDLKSKKEKTIVVKSVNRPD